MRALFRILIILLLSVLKLNAQIQIVPPVIFIDPVSKSAIVRVINSESKPKEISFHLKFGYTDSDSLARQIMTYDTTKTEWALNKFMKIFPKKLVLPPNGEQTIRLLIMDKPEYPEGTYWTRLVIRMEGSQKQLDTSNVNNKSKISTKINTELINSVIYQKGKVNTGLQVGEVTTNEDSVSRNILINFERTGNSPFIGVAKLKLFNEKGDLVGAKNELLPVYYKFKRKFSLPKAKILPGKYKGELEFTNQRDVPFDAEKKVDFENFKHEFEITIP